MSSPDRAVERTADRLERLAARAAERGIAGEKVAPFLEDDAEFLRKLTPSKVKERLRANTSPEISSVREPKGRTHGVIVLAAAFALGVVVAKLIEWRSYAT
jgi:hypothetical protein